MRLYTITLLSGRQYETTDSMKASLFVELFGGIESVIGFFSEECKKQEPDIICTEEMSDYGAYYRIKKD